MGVGREHMIWDELGFYGPINTVKVITSQSVSQRTLFSLAGYA